MPVFIEARLEGPLQRTDQARLVRRPLCPAEAKAQTAPLPQCQPVGLEGEGIQPLRRLVQAAAEIEILELALHGLPGRFELGLTLEIKGQIPLCPLGRQGHRYPLPRGQLPQIEIQPVEPGDGTAAVVPHQGAGIHQRDALQADLPGLFVTGGWGRRCGGLGGRLPLGVGGGLEQVTQVGAAVSPGLDKQMSAAQGHLADLKPVGEQRQQAYRGLTLLESHQVGLGKAGGVAQRHLLEGEAQAWPETPADIPLYHQLAAGALAHLFHQLGLELIGIDEGHQGGDGHHGRQRQPQQDVDDLLHDGLLECGSCG